MSTTVTIIKKVIEYIINYEMQYISRRCEKLFKIILTITRFVNCLNYQNNCLMNNYFDENFSIIIKKACNEFCD